MSAPAPTISEGSVRRANRRGHQTGHVPVAEAENIGNPGSWRGPRSVYASNAFRTSWSLALAYAIVETTDL